METSEHFRIDGAIISESTPIAETIMASSNETLVNMFRNIQVVFFVNYPLIRIGEVVNFDKLQT